MYMKAIFAEKMKGIVGKLEMAKWEVHLELIKSYVFQFICGHCLGKRLKDSNLGNSWAVMRGKID